MKCSSPVSRATIAIRSCMPEADTRSGSKTSGCSSFASTGPGRYSDRDCSIPALTAIRSLPSFGSRPRAPASCAINPREKSDCSSSSGVSASSTGSSGVPVPGGSGRRRRSGSQEERDGASAGLAPWPTSSSHAGASASSRDSQGRGVNMSSGPVMEHQSSSTRFRKPICSWRVGYWARPAARMAPADAPTKIVGANPGSFAYR